MVSGRGGAGGPCGSPGTAPATSPGSVGANGFKTASRRPGLSFFLADALRRPSSGSFGQFGAFTSAAGALSGGGKSSLGGTTSGDRSRYWIFPSSMLLPPRMVVLMPSMILSEKPLLSSSSAARAVPAVIATAKAIMEATVLKRMALVAALNEFRTIQPRASVSRIGLPVQSFVKSSASRHPGANSVPFRNVNEPRPRDRIGRDQGAFAAGSPRKESYSRAATPATIATSAKLNTYQL